MNQKILWKPFYYIIVNTAQALCGIDYTFNHQQMVSMSHCRFALNSLNQMNLSNRHHLHQHFLMSAWFYLKHGHLKVQRPIGQHIRHYSHHL